MSDRGWARGYENFFWQWTHLYLGRFTLVVNHRLVLKQPVPENPQAGLLKKCRWGTGGGNMEKQATVGSSPPPPTPAIPTLSPR